LALGRSAKFNPAGIDGSGAAGLAGSPPDADIDGRGTTCIAGCASDSSAGIDDEGTTSSIGRASDSAASIDGRAISSAEPARGGRYVGSKPTANPRSAASIGLL
jgi:hypothetical protein